MSARHLERLLQIDSLHEVPSRNANALVSTSGLYNRRGDRAKLLIILKISNANEGERFRPNALCAIASAVVGFRPIISAHFYNPT